MASPSTEHDADTARAADGRPRAALGTPRRCFAAALAFSIVAHAAAIGFLDGGERAPVERKPRTLRVAHLAMASRAAAPEVSVPSAAPNLATANTQRRERGPRRSEVVHPARATAEPAAQAATEIAPTTPAPAVADAPPAPTPATEGIGVMSGIAGFGGGMRRRWYDPQPHSPTATVATGAPLHRTALGAQAAEAELVGTLFARLNQRWSGIASGEARCELRLGENGPVAACESAAPSEALAVLVDAPGVLVEAPALLDRFGCLRLERSEAGSRVRPCG